MTGGTAAHRYAKALFGLAEDEHRHREVRTEREGLQSLFDENRELIASESGQCISSSNLGFESFGNLN